jgi:hypothetical protein
MNIVIFISGAMIWHPGVPCQGTRIACALRIETEIKGANILHCNADMQMNFPQIRTIPAKVASNSRPSSPDKLPFEMMSAGQVDLKTGANGTPDSCVARSRTKPDRFSFQQPSQRIDIATIKPLDCSVIIRHLSLIWRG